MAIWKVKVKAKNFTKKELRSVQKTIIYKYSSLI